MVTVCFFKKKKNLTIYAVVYVYARVRPCACVWVIKKNSKKHTCFNLTKLYKCMMPIFAFINNWFAAFKTANISSRVKAQRMYSKGGSGAESGASGLGGGGDVTFVREEVLLLHKTNSGLLIVLLSSFIITNYVMITLAQD